MESWKQKGVLFLVFFGVLLGADFDTNNSLIEFYGLSDEKINIVIKDNIDIEGKVTSAGSIALKDNIASENAFIIQKLIDANYNIAGKANLSEWANFRSEESVSGWSSLGGQTTHYLFNNFNPCGSSSGSAVAVASGIVDIAIGTETNGSISCPSSINGIVGMKPTVGLVSRSGIIPISKTQDTAGPMGKSVKLVAKTLEVISGYDPDDPATSRIPDNFIFDFSSDLDNASLEGKRFGLLDSNNSSDQVKELHSVLIAFIESRGGSVIRFDDFRRYPGDDEYFLLKYEFKHGLERYLADSNSQMKTLKEIIEFNEVNKEKTMPFFDQGIFYSSLELSEEHERYKKALQALMETKNQSLNILNEYKLDAFIGLTRGPAWKIDYNGGDRVAAEEVSSFGSGGFAAIAGLPHISIPFFQIAKFPIGVSLIGEEWSEKKLIEFAYVFEQENEFDLYFNDNSSKHGCKVNLLPPRGRFKTNYQIFTDCDTSKAIVPLYKAFPNYPRRANVNEIMGFSIIEFDMLENGATANHKVVETFCGNIRYDGKLYWFQEKDGYISWASDSNGEKLYLPKGAYDPIQCEFFNKSSLDAAKKLQYKNESGFPIKGLKHKFTYTLEGKSFKKQ